MKRKIFNTPGMTTLSDTIFVCDDCCVDELRKTRHTYVLYTFDVCIMEEQSCAFCRKVSECYMCDTPSVNPQVVLKHADESHLRDFINTSQITDQVNLKECNYCDDDDIDTVDEDEMCPTCKEELRECAEWGGHFKGSDYLVCRDCLSFLKACRGSDDRIFQCEKCDVNICVYCWEEAVKKNRQGGLKAWEEEKKRLDDEEDDFIVCFRCYNGD